MLRVLQTNVWVDRSLKSVWGGMRTTLDCMERTIPLQVEPQRLLSKPKVPLQWNPLLEGKSLPHAGTLQADPQLPRSEQRSLWAASAMAARRPSAAVLAAMEA